VAPASTGADVHADHESAAGARDERGLSLEEKTVQRTGTSSHENQQWGVFLSENHRKHHEYSKAKKREQSEYWNWRHAHPDKDRQEFPNLK